MQDFGYSTGTEKHTSPVLDTGGVPGTQTPWNCDMTLCGLPPPLPSFSLPLSIISWFIRSFICFFIHSFIVFNPVPSKDSN